MQQLMMSEGSKQVQDHMESDLRSSQLTTLLVVDIFCTTTRAPGNSQGDKHARPESRSSSSPSTFATLPTLLHPPSLVQNEATKINTDQGKEGENKTPSLREIYNTTNTIEDYIVSIVYSDVSTSHSYVTDNIIALVPMLTLRQVLRSPNKDKWLEVVQVEVGALQRIARGQSSKSHMTQMW